MALHLPPPPANGAQVVSQAIEDLQRSRRLGVMAGRTRARALSPLPIYTLSRGALEQPEPLAAAEATGWRYIVQLGRALHLVDLGADGSAGEIVFRALRTGPRAGLFLEGCRIAEDLSTGKPNRDVRVLRAPSESLEALWLQGETTPEFVFLRGPIDRPIGLFDLVDTVRDLAARRSGTGSPASEELGG